MSSESPKIYYISHTATFFSDNCMSIVGYYGTWWGVTGEIDILPLGCRTLLVVWVLYSLLQHIGEGLC